MAFFYATTDACYLYRRQTQYLDKLEDSRRDSKDKRIELQLSLILKL